MRAAEFDFHLPEELIAQQPSSTRDSSRLLTLHRNEKRVSHGTFPDLLNHLAAGDVLVLNNSKVVPARLRSVNPVTGGAFEILLLEENSRNDWWAMMRPAKRARIGTEFSLIDRRGERSAVSATVLETNQEGHRRLIFRSAVRVPMAPWPEFDISKLLDDFGEVPLPPYIKRGAGHSSTDDRTRYQTVYAKEKGSIAAPTAGLHFTDQLLAQICARGVEICYLTLHVGLGTFAPVKTDDINEHRMHFERFHVDESTAQKVNAAKQAQRRVVAVGTTSVRVLEALALQHNGRIAAGSGRTNIFIHPPFQFRVVDALVTNFHLPRSTLLMLVSAFASPGETSGCKKILAAYAEAVMQRYRFFSYGDAMLIV
ncbi:MAG TPA: tRNA preQ1(34) S-adenosylmethionine ribosyltransferase-isomerase QueA [Methylomirabilota bacterium]|nr:tRNA preQ1(34) S-adenosylmethionine ribosyltransferase-isomerase QueA [Methylomirabilota bacterium]